MRQLSLRTGSPEYRREIARDVNRRRPPLPARCAAAGCGRCGPGVAPGVPSRPMEPDASAPAASEHAEHRAAELAAILETAVDGIVTIDVEGRIRSFNPAAERIFGYRASEVLGRNVSLLMPSPWAEEHDAYIRRYLETGQARIIGIGREVEGLRKDGTRFPCELAVTEVRSGARRVFTAFVRDLTARERVREALRRERDFAQRLIELLPAVVVLLDRAGRLERCNRHFERLCGAAAREAAGCDWFETFLAPEGREAARAAFARALEATEPTRALAPLQVGQARRHEIEWHATGVPDADGGVRRVLAVGLDVSERVQAARRLEAQVAITRALEHARTLEEAQGEVLAALGHALRWPRIELWSTDAEGRARERIGGFPHADASGPSLGFPPGAEAPFGQARSGPRWWARLESGGRTWSAVAVPIATRKGRCGALWLFAPPERSLRESEAEMLAAFAAQLGDFVERRALEAEFRQAQKLEAVGRLAAGIAHDFKNLLMGIRGCAALMEADRDDPVARRRFVQEIATAVDRGIELTDQLLAFSRRRPEVARAVEVDAEIEASAGLIRSLAGEEVSVAIELEAAGARVLAEPGHVQQIVMNLVTNARDAMPRGGRLLLRTRRTAQPEGWSPAEPDSAARACVEITVRDEGCGMDPETRAHAFDPFFTTKGPGEGSGLGLSTVYGIVRQLGGSIELESEPARGTTVRIVLPLAQQLPEDEAQLTAGQGAERRPAASWAGRRVLVVEDEPLVRMTAVEFLEGLGCAAIEASSAEQALERIDRERPALDLVLTDMVLPGMGGPQLATELRERYPGLPAVFMSAYPPDLLVEQGRLAAGTPALEKPFDERALAAALHEAWGAHEAD
ncbi:MAG: PAS domain S-box protein [Planctomycetota bacterium]|nr:MAG: PAS domain S-box protein [Planctomycetota bacterium]